MGKVRVVAKVEDVSVCDSLFLGVVSLLLVRVDLRLRNHLSQLERIADLTQDLEVLATTHLQHEDFVVRASLLA